MRLRILGQTGLKVSIDRDHDAAFSFLIEQAWFLGPELHEYAGEHLGERLVSLGSQTKRDRFHLDQ